MSALPIQSCQVTLPQLGAPLATAADPSPLATRRRRHAAAAPRAIVLSQGGQGVAMLGRTQQLPFAVSASVSANRGILYPLAGAAIGTLLLGIPGTIIGGIVGYLIGRR
ncbi:MAG: hypothetical protein JWM98_2447 [Thermoleophilia bacterium]|nr:hypothetical protein [Thermoleophilia bacterium]